MLRAVGMLENGAIQRVVAEGLHISQSVISRLWSRYRSTGDGAKRHTGRCRVTTQRQDRFLQMTARRQPNITVMQLVQRLQEDHQLLVSDQTVRRRLHEVNLHARKPHKQMYHNMYHRVTNNDLWYCSLMSPVSGFIRIHVEHEFGKLQEE
jgi:transposase